MPQGNIMWEWLHFNTASYFSGDASLFNSKLYLVPLNLFAATRDKRKSARFTHIQSCALSSWRVERLALPKQPIKVSLLFLKRSPDCVPRTQLTSSSFSRCTRGVKRKLRTSHANGGCQSWVEQSKNHRQWTNRRQRTVKNIAFYSYFENCNFHLGHSAAVPNDQLSIVMSHFQEKKKLALCFQPPAKLLCLIFDVSARRCEQGAQSKRKRLNKPLARAVFISLGEVLSPLWHHKGTLSKTGIFRAHFCKSLASK